MRILRVGAVGREVPAIMAEDGSLRDLSTVTRDIDRTFLENDGLSRAQAALDSGALAELPQEGIRIGAPLRPGKIVGIGLNYRDHAMETGGWLPEEPVVFLKAADTVVGPSDPLLLPRGSTKLDWEVELGVVIGRTARYLESTADAVRCIAGYTISHDVSEREFQLERGGQWDKGKNCETFNPLGPWLVTSDEVADPQNLRLRLRVNDEPRQTGTTADMIFPVAEVIRYLSQFMVLYPGDLVNTGTPAGVALGMPDPKAYLRVGDVVELEIDGLGRQRQVVAAAE
ncbi:fumarylacetoacetate hydrolase family protein [Saccharothrix deserti]|uniref:fumarylacetoacetate hydrolase family protein n=1 Tax=Saccharothrix deserti TaxID=2593674 RepID=UPI00131D4489|nr:fumarylacetoacetate hydrolase family protein [Saccharothrix deserti]